MRVIHTMGVTAKSLILFVSTKIYFIHPCYLPPFSQQCYDVRNSSQFNEKHNEWLAISGTQVRLVNGSLHHS